MEIPIQPFKNSAALYTALYLIMQAFCGPAPVEGDL
jgi:hypothetical protein